jgi:hypothetical protein
VPPLDLARARRPVGINQAVLRNDAPPEVRTAEVRAQAGSVIPRAGPRPRWCAPPTGPG